MDRLCKQDERLAAEKIAENGEPNTWMASKTLARELDIDTTREQKKYGLDSRRRIQRRKISHHDTIATHL